MYIMFIHTESKHPFVWIFKHGCHFQTCPEIGACKWPSYGKAGVNPKENNSLLSGVSIKESSKEDWHKSNQPINSLHGFPKSRHTPRYAMKFTAVQRSFSAFVLLLFIQCQAAINSVVRKQCPSISQTKFQSFTLKYNWSVRYQEQ